MPDALLSTVFPFITSVYAVGSAVTLTEDTFVSATAVTNVPDAIIPVRISPVNIFFFHN